MPRWWGGADARFRIVAPIYFRLRMLRKVLRSGAVRIVGAEHDLRRSDHLGQRRHRDRVRGLGGVVIEAWGGDLDLISPNPGDRLSRTNEAVACEGARRDLRTGGFAQD